MQLLAVGDIHLGREPTRLPETAMPNPGPRDVGPGAAWRRTVEQAIELGVTAVLLAGDVVDDDDDFYEAYADLRRGVERLAGAGIRVLAIAGNHDGRVLPQLADSLADQTGFQLLGRGGQWETVRLEGSDGRGVAVTGWSFASATVRESPLAGGIPVPDDVTTIGLLHCDRDQMDSPYAPVRSEDLSRAPVAAWLLGHIHKPDALSGTRPMGYLGSLSGLDPGEPGAHGPWLVSIDGAGVHCRQLPLAPLRWEPLEVRLDDLDSPEAIRAAITRAMAALHEHMTDLAQRPAAVGCRVRLTGRSGHRGAIEQLLESEDLRELIHDTGETMYFVEAWRMEALPAVALASLARASDPAGLLAQKLLVLRGPDCEARRALIAGARERLAPRVRQRPFDRLGAEPPDNEATRELLERAAWRSLEALLAQRGEVEE